MCRFVVSSRCACILELLEGRGEAKVHEREGTSKLHNNLRWMYHISDTPQAKSGDKRSTKKGD